MPYVHDDVDEDSFNLSIYILCLLFYWQDAYEPEDFITPYIDDDEEDDVFNPYGGQVITDDYKG